MAGFRLLADLLGILRSLTWLDVTDRTSCFVVLGEVLLISGHNGVQKLYQKLGLAP